MFKTATVGASPLATASLISALNLLYSIFSFSIASAICLSTNSLSKLGLFFISNPKCLLTKA